MNRREMIEKFSSIIKTGYTPSRGTKKYIYLNKLCNKKINHGIRINCFLHCFNFTNEQIERLNLDRTSDEIVSFGIDLAHKAERKALSFLRATGLIVKPCTNIKAPLSNNQWRIAFYNEEDFDEGEECNNWHFLLQEKNGKWTSKQGFSGDVTIYNKLPEKIAKPFTPWVLRNTYVVTNPYADEEKASQM